MPNVKRGTKYYSEQIDRHGKPVYYYRRPGFPRVRLDAQPGTTAMDIEFHKAKAKVDGLAADKEAGVDKPRPMVVCRATQKPEYAKRFGDVAGPGADGTLRSLCTAFMASDYFADLDAQTAAKYRCNLMRACALRTKDGTAAYGEWMVETMELQHVEAISAQLKSAPTVADNTCKMLRAVFNWAAEQKLFMGRNPAVGFTVLRNYDDDEDPDSDGHHTWEQDELELFMQAHPLGSPARMSFALMYYAGVRKSDALRLGPWQLKAKGTELHWKEFKNGQSAVKGKRRPRAKPRKMQLHPELARTIAATKTTPERFVLKQDGTAYTRGGFNWALEQWIDEAGLPAACTAHGIRKAAAALMFLNGATEAELCSVFGWKIGSRMAAHYARKYNKQRAQSQAFARLPQLGSESSKVAA